MIESPAKKLCLPTERARQSASVDAVRSSC
jgi:hypothetical protein